LEAIEDEGGAGALRRDAWLMRLVAGAVGPVVVVMIFVVAHLLVVVTIVRIVRHNAPLGAKVLKRYNALILPVAGRRFSPYALLRHTGRRSGRAHLTPLGAYRFGDGFVLGLTYGPGADWCRNVAASGHAMLRWHGQDYALERPEVIPMSPRVLGAFPLALRPLLARELTHCLWLHQPRPEQ
jgi:hypothetical protein